MSNEIQQVASASVSHCKIFIRGLPWSVSSETLTEIFAEFGPVREAAVIMDKITGKSRGFGFVTFESMDSANRSLVQPNKMIEVCLVRVSLRLSS